MIRELGMKEQYILHQPEGRLRIPFYGTRNKQPKILRELLKEHIRLPLRMQIFARLRRQFPSTTNSTKVPLIIQMAW